MKDEKLEIMINEFIDGELSKDKENYLFTALGNDDEAREYFKKLSSIRTVIGESFEAFPSDLEESIFSEMKNRKSNGLFYFISQNRYSFLTYALMILIIIAGYFFFDQYSYQQHQLELAKKQMKQQEQMIQLIMSNQLPPVTVEPDSENEIVIQATL